MPASIAWNSVNKEERSFETFKGKSTDSSRRIKCINPINNRAKQLQDEHEPGEVAQIQINIPAWLQKDRASQKKVFCKCSLLLFCSILIRFLTLVHCRFMLCYLLLQMSS